MARRYGDPIAVRTGTPSGDDAEGDSTSRPPSSFLWRGRLYVVRSVLGHWRERRAWWNEAAARAVHGADHAVGEPSEPVSRHVAVERQVWRVEASAGRTAGVGVYDLCHDPSATWTLARVAD